MCVTSANKCQKLIKFLYFINICVFAIAIVFAFVFAVFYVQFFVCFLANCVANAAHVAVFSSTSCPCARAPFLSYTIYPLLSPPLLFLALSICLSLASVCLSPTHSLLLRSPTLFTHVPSATQQSHKIFKYKK